MDNHDNLAKLAAETFDAWELFRAHQMMNQPIDRDKRKEAAVQMAMAERRAIELQARLDRAKREGSDTNG